MQLTSAQSQSVCPGPRGLPDFNGNADWACVGGAGVDRGGVVVPFINLLIFIPTLCRIAKKQFEEQSEAAAEQKQMMVIHKRNAERLSSKIEQKEKLIKQVQLTLHFAKKCSKNSA